MAQRDLDAALQLLADRAQYITGANGAAIALRRNGKQDLLCRASIGPNAPELGALLSTEFGLSGESVRTRKVLRCDDAERDARVNREVCRQLKIASVVVMPVVHDDEVMGVFELFSEKAHAFGPRDLVALERLSEMVDTAIRLARAAEELPERLKNAEVPLEATPVEIATPFKVAVLPDVAEPSVPEQGTVLEVEIHTADARVEASEKVLTPAATPPIASPPPAKPPKRALLWSAAPQTTETQKSTEDQSHVPPVLRGLSKCEACGFPVSAGRKLCVDCEEKKWRGQGKPQPVSKQVATAAAAAKDGRLATGRAADSLTPTTSASSTSASAISAFQTPPANVGTFPGRCFQSTSESEVAFHPSVSAAPVPAAPIPAKVIPTATIPTKLPDVNESKRVISSPPIAATVQKAPVQQKVQPKEIARKTAPSAVAPPAFVLSAGLEPSQTWFSANKYILGAIAIIAASVAAVLLLR